MTWKRAVRARRRRSTGPGQMPGCCRTRRIMRREFSSCWSETNYISRPVALRGCAAPRRLEQCAPFVISVRNHMTIRFRTGFLRAAARLSLTAALVVPSAAPAADAIRVIDPWARATVPGQEVGGGYMEVVSPRDARL